MTKAESICQCGHKRRLISAVEIYCGRCGKKILNNETVESLDHFNREVANELGAPDLDGNIRQKLGRATIPFDPERRKALNKLLVGFTLGTATTVAGGLFLLQPRIIQFEEEIKSNWRRQQLTLDELEAVENAASNFKKLARLHEYYTTNGKHAAAAFALSLVHHAKGVAPENSLLPLNELLADDREAPVKQRLLLRRAKVLGAVGRISEGLKDLDHAIALASDPLERCRLLRQTMSHTYISIEPSRVAIPEQWTELQRYLEQALSVSGLPVDGKLPWNSVVRHAIRFHPIIGPGILVFYLTLRADEARTDRALSADLLRRHWSILKYMEATDPINAWIRYTPLAAQAIRLRQNDIARQVLERARAVALGRQRSESSEYASLQRKGNSIEWLFHKVLFARLHLAYAHSSRHRANRKHHIRRARAELKQPLAPENAIRGTSYLRKAKLYMAETFSSEQARREARVGANNTMAFTHWSYLP